METRIRDDLLDAYDDVGISHILKHGFRWVTRGFIELTAVSHLPLAVCYVAHMRDQCFRRTWSTPHLLRVGFRLGAIE